MYDPALAERIRQQLAGADGISEKKMFGGLAFLLDGNMAVSASGRGGLLVRVDPEDTEALVSQPGVARMEMGGRSMDGWITVEADAVRADSELERWVSRGLGYAKTLPPK